MTQRPAIRAGYHVLTLILVKDDQSCDAERSAFLVKRKESLIFLPIVSPRRRGLNLMSPSG